MKIPAAVYSLLLGNFKNHSALSYMNKNISSSETMCHTNLIAPFGSNEHSIPNNLLKHRLLKLISEIEKTNE